MSDRDMRIEAAQSKALQPEWSNAPTVGELEHDYIEANASHSAMVSKISGWLDNLNLTGSAKFNPPKGRSGVQPKVIRKQAEWRYASLSDPFLSTEDLYDVHPISHEDKPRAEQNGTILNHQWNTVLNKQKFVDDYVHTAVDEGTVICRVGWVLEEKEVEEVVELFDYMPDLTQETMQMMQQASQLKATAPDSFNQLPENIKAALAQTEATGLPHIAVPNGQSIELVNKIVKNHPTVDVVKYSDVRVDPTCGGDLAKAMFITYEYSSSHSALKAEGKYTNLDAITMVDEEVDLTDDEFGSGSFKFADKPREKFTVKEYWGFWDIDGSGVVKPIVAAYVGNTMILLEESPYPDGGLPFVAAQYLPKRREVHGEPDGELLVDNQRIIGATTRGMIDIMARASNGQVGHRADAMDATNRIKFRRGDDYEYTSAVDPSQAFYMHKYQEIPQSAPLLIQLQNQDAESLTGVKAFTSGITGNALGDTVGGQRNALDATAKREVSILRRLAKGTIEIGNKIMAMNDVWLSEDEVTRITNKPYIAPREEYGTQFDLRVTISTADEDDAKASELSFMLQTMGNTVDFSITQKILVDIAKLRKMHALAKSLEEYTPPPPDPLEQQKLQLENNVLQLEAVKLQAEIAQIQSNAGLNTAKTANTESDTDLKDLEFIERENGTEQERELEQGRAQAQGNMALKVVEAGLNKDKPEAKAKPEK